MKAIVVSVEFDGLLAITLPRNARHFERVVGYLIDKSDANRVRQKEMENRYRECAGQWRV